MARFKEIIVVDDDHEILDMVQAIIEEADKTANVHLFDNTESALEEVGYSAEDIDLIITDYQVPKLNGDGFAREAQKYTSCPIVLFSGDPSIQDKDFGSLFTNKISKYNQPELLPLIKNILNP